MARNDFWSDPDLVVEVHRWDQRIMRRVHLLGTDLHDARRALDSVREDRSALERKKLAAEVVPGPPLTPAHAARLASLAAEVGESCPARPDRACASCSPQEETEACRRCRQCGELRDLRQRKAESEIVRGEPLTTQESAAFDALTIRQAALQDTIADFSDERARLLSSVRARTDAITTTRMSMHFAHQELIVVFPGDVVEVTVFEEDTSEDDLFGRTVILLDQETLASGALELMMPNVRQLRLGFRPTRDEHP